MFHDRRDTESRSPEPRSTGCSEGIPSRRPRWSALFLRRMARRLKALVAILLALAAGLFLVSCGRRPTAVTPPPPPPRPAEPAPPAAEPAGEKNVPPPPPKEPEQPKVDKEEHRKGLPVRDNMLE